MGERPMSQQKQVVVITGASAGVGRATVQRFARAGADIGLIARGEAGLDGARQDVEAAGGRALVLPVDVADADAVQAAADRVERELGPIDVWVNDAMTTVFAEFKDITPDEFRRVTEVCYLGFVNGTRAALAHMLPRDHGTIVQVGSALAYRAIPLQSAYCGAKHAIRGFTDSVRTELLHDRSKVWITMVQMPALNTPQFDWCENKMQHHSQPVPPIYDPSVAAEGIFFAAHHRRREVWVGASTAVVITGNKLLPGVGDRYLARTGFDSQQYDGPPQTRATNLWRPMDTHRDRGARGSFSDRAHGRSLELWASMHKGALALAGVGATAALLVLALRATR
jgi:NAD(P)-dependent dehydrogenase (short-subunit alcohol dehydrogenase family)